MLSHIREYHRPKTIEEALALLRRPSVPTAILAGGTQLVARRAPGVNAVVDLQALNLQGIRMDASAVHIGAMTPIQDLIQSEVSRQYASGLLAKAARHCAPRNIRNAATIGGTVASADSRDELYVALVACGATVILNEEEGSGLAIEALTPERLRYDIITRIVVPPAHCGVLERVARTPSDRAIVAVAAVRAPYAGGRSLCRVAIGGISPRVVTATTVASDASQARSELRWHVDTPLGDAVASAPYRQAVTDVLVSRAIEALWR
ncbi:MAG: xanthine dehydrogenase family protein subunit M [Anaerolineae bacterium]